jgi:hypothetical protein
MLLIRMFSQQSLIIAFDSLTTIVDLLFEWTWGD